MGPLKSIITFPAAFRSSTTRKSSRDDHDYHCRASHSLSRPCNRNPGLPFAGASRIAYLPDNAEGRRLLKRLEYAFSKGLTFTVGTSLSTGQGDVVTWASIHHKTSISGGAHGFPDPSYFYNCNDELDAVGVPSADLL